jgi:hypothetical protein
MRIPIDNVGMMGIIQDIPPYAMPPEAWSNGQNVRMLDGSVWKSFGNLQILGTLLGSPRAMLTVASQIDQFYVYPTLTQLFASDGTSHSDVSRASGGPYSAGTGDRWTGCVLGGIILANNPVDVPQMWLNPNLANKFANLSNWNSTWRCRVLRNFKTYLLALNTIEGANGYPYRIRWSNSAVSGSVPDTWNPAPGNDARYWDLIESDGFVIDSLPLADINFVYKEDQIHSMEYIGGDFVFRFQKRFDQGILAVDCAREWQGKHYVMTGDDIVMHNGFEMQSAISQKMRTWYKGRVDPTYYTRSFMALSSNEKEIWCCIPENGNQWPNIALVINLETGRLAIREIPQCSGWFYAYVSGGLNTFDAQATPFDQMVGQFGSANFAAGKKRLGLVSAGVSKVFMAEQGFTFDGISYRSFVERTGLAIIGRDRQGNPKNDFNNRKLLSRIWPKIRVANGTTVNVYAGAQETVDSPIQWQGPFPFRPGVDNEVFPNVTGRLLAVRFETTDNTYWKLDGYDVEVSVVGAY